MVIFISALIFIASVLLIALNSLLVPQNWKTLKVMLETLPEGERRIRFNLRAINEQKLKFKAGVILVHFIGCVSFGFSIAACALVILKKPTIIKVK